MRVPATFGLLLLLAGCASGGGGGTGEPERDRYVLTAEELASYPTLNAYEAIERLRRFWLQERGGAPQVFLNEERVTLAALRYWRTDRISEMHFIDGNEARIRFASVGSSSGVIVVTLRE